MCASGSSGSGGGTSGAGLQSWPSLLQTESVQGVNRNAPGYCFIMYAGTQESGLIAVYGLLIKIIFTVPDQI